jgi:hypothetical protein
LHNVNLPDESSTIMKVVLLPLEAVKPHERVKADHVVKIKRAIQADRAVMQPLIVAQGCNTLLDGHHRYTALRKLGARYAPCIEVNYDDAAQIEVTAWRGDEAVTSQSVREAALYGFMMPPKTSRHILKFPVPTICVPLRDLLADAPIASVHANARRLERTQ